MNWLADERRRLDKRREELLLRWAANKLAAMYRRLDKVVKGEWHEEDHPRAEDGRFGDKPGEHGGQGGTDEGQGADKPATPAAQQQRPAKPKALRAAGRYRNAA